MSDKSYIFQIENSSEPIIATAIHAGHDMSTFLEEHCALSESQRLYEEDPFTDEWASRYPNHIIVNKSRFELDLNRPRETAVYLKPEDAWGLDVWEYLPPQRTLERLYKRYDEFYEGLDSTVQHLLAENPKVIILDLHSYNHKRNGITASRDANPQLNIGTGTIKNREAWRSIIHCVIDELRDYTVDSIPLDVRENVKFKGGHMAAWLHEKYPESVCVLSIETKKFFMDEQTGKRDPVLTTALGDYFQDLKGSLLQTLQDMV